MTDAEIFKRNVKRICKQKHMKMGCVDLEAGYNEKHISEMAYKGCSITTEHIRAYARALGVKPWKLTEGMFDGVVGHEGRSCRGRIQRQPPPPSRMQAPAADGGSCPVLCTGTRRKAGEINGGIL